MSVRYNVLTWDPAAECYTSQDGLASPSLNVSLFGLRRVLRELRAIWGYACDYQRNDDGTHSGDPSVLVERADDPLVDEIMTPASHVAKEKGSCDSVQ